MSIKITSPKVVPSVTLDKMHLDQLVMQVDRQTGEYKVSASAVTCGDTSDGTYFSSSTKSINDDAFLSTAVTRAVALGEVKDRDDFQSKVIEAQIAANDQNLTTAQALVAFEDAVRIMFIIAGHKDIGDLK